MELCPFLKAFLDKTMKKWTNEMARQWPGDVARALEMARSAEFSFSRKTYRTVAFSGT